MRLLLDECVNAGVRKALSGHLVSTVAESGWSSIKDGPLLLLAQQRFDVFVTIDRSLEHQQNLARLKMGVVIIRVPNNEIESYQPIFELIRTAVEAARPGVVVRVVHPDVKP